MWGGWFQVYAMGLQVVFWGLWLPRVVSRRTLAIVSFTQLPEDPRF